MILPNQTSIHKPSKLNLDKSRKYLKGDESFFLSNHDVLNVLDKSTPLAANYPACEMEMPEGETFSIGAYHSPLTNEVYSFNYNSNNVFFISRLSANGCDIIYTGECLNFSANPIHSIEQWRCYLDIEKICKNRHGKRLIFTDGLNEIRCIDVEASLATDSFSTPFFDRCNTNECEFINLCVPQPCGCLSAEYVPLPDADSALTNNLADKAFKFIYRYVYYDNRASEWSSVSSLYYQNIKGGCFEGEEGFARCLKLTVPIGNPMGDKIEIGFSTDNGVSWLLSETVNKYASYTSSSQYWYEREINPDLDLTDDGCSFYYTFCNDKQCRPIDSKEVSRVYNPLPREAQGLLTIKDALALYNYKQGTCPIDKIETDKVSVGLNCQDDICETDYVTVKVRAIIHSLHDNTSEFIFRENGNYTDEDDISDPAYFGAFERIVGMPYYKSFDQQFKGKKRNFTAYIEGTNYHSELTQWKAFNGFTQNAKVGVISGFLNGTTRYTMSAITTSGYYYYQEGEFRVPKGTRGFIRLDSHASPTFDPDTSTFVLGTIANITGYVSNSALPTVKSTHEIYFDACAGNVTLAETFIINDNGEESGSKAFNGYVKDAEGLPIESVNLYTTDDFFLCTTDHNGFYHFTLTDWTNPAPIQVSMEIDCTDFGYVETQSVVPVNGVNIRKDILVTNTDYINNFYANVNGKVVDCEGNGVGGIPVAISGSKYRVTNSSGDFFQFIHNIPTRDREVRVVLMDRSGCFSLDCNNNCNPCMPMQVMTAPECFDEAVHAGAPPVTFVDLVLNKNQKDLNFRGLKKGGGYEWGIVAVGDCGRISSVYPLKDGYMSIPKMQQDNNENFCSFTYNTNGISLPDWVTCLLLVRTENLNNYELQWVVDKIERTSDGNIRLTIQSLNDYNLGYNGKSNTIYQYAKGDRVEFISNGNGNTFIVDTYGQLNYNTLSPFNNEDLSGSTEADFFNQILIKDDGKLSSLVAGAKIEIQRSKECAIEPAYFGICVSLKVVNGQVVVPQGAFETFDTYRVTRQIGSFAPQFFESAYPSDFYANKVSDIGKAYFVNKYENERRYGRNISIASPTQINYFGDNIKTFDAPEHGDITAASITDGKVLLVIGEHDNFLAQVSDELVRVGSDGIIRAIPPDQIISDAQPKLSGAFGCQYPHIGSVYFGDGYAMYCDVNKNAYVRHDYNTATDVSETKLKTYFKSKFPTISTINNGTDDYLDHIRFATGRNKHNGAIYLTTKSLRQLGANNNSRPLQTVNETIAYHPIMDDFLTFVGFTAEGYSNIDLFDGAGAAFVSFFEGLPYVHPIIATEFNRFFGIYCDRYVGFSINTLPTKAKVPLSLEIEDLIAWYVKEMTTEKLSFLSEIPISRFKRTENKWNASFLRDKNTRGGLFNGEQARSYNIDVLLVRDNVEDNKYNIFDDSKRLLYDELDLIISKYLVSEQSGYSENL